MVIKNFVSFLLLAAFFELIKCKTLLKPIVIAHRGASGYLPEHTLEAKSMAFTMGSDYIEQDLVLSKDYVPIVLHDIYLDEVTDVEIKFGPSRARPDKRYYAIDFTYDEIKSLKVTERYLPGTMDVPKYPNRFPLWKSSFQLNSFREEIELIQGLQKSLKQSSNHDQKVIGIYPEIKNPHFHFTENYKNFSEIVLQILAEYNYTESNDPVYLQCFDPFELIRIRKELKSKLPLIQLLDTESDERINYTYWNSEDGLRNISTFAQGIGPYKDQLIVLDSNNKYVKPSDLTLNAKKLFLKMHPYTFRVDALPPYARNNNELMRIFIDEVGVDGVFTDFPDVALDYINEYIIKNASNKVFYNFYLLFVAIVAFLKL